MAPGELSYTRDQGTRRKFFPRNLLDSFCGRGSNMKNFKLKAVGYQIIPVVLWLNTSKIPQTLNGGHFTLSTSSGTTRLILLP